MTTDPEEHIMTAIENPIDEAAVEQFVDRVLTDVSAAMTIRLASIGDRLGLWKDLAANGPATSHELAGRTGTVERYTREWLNGVHAAGYVEFDPATGVYTLPAAAHPVLAQEAGPVFFGGTLESVQGLNGAYDAVCEAFRTGGGAGQEHFDAQFWSGLSRFTAGWFEHLLVPVWLPLMPAVQAKLEAGCTLADVGTGAAKALITLAEHYPNSRFVGYDAFPAQLELARANIEEAGLSDRITVEVRDVAADGLPEQFDIVTTFDVVHDAIDPAGLLRAIRRGLADDGRFVCLDINASHRPEDNIGPLAAFFYGISVQYCMTVSLAQGGAGLGTCGFNPITAEAMCADAGFSSVRLIEMENPFNNLYEIRP
jgi:SAM-dependent methyltransferase